MDADQVAEEGAGTDDMRHFSLREIEWFSKTAFNLALTYCKSWPIKDAIGMFGRSCFVLFLNQFSRLQSN